MDYNDSILQLSSFKNFNSGEHLIPFKSKAPTIEGYSAATPGSFKTFF
jgi:hypothetical protein